MLRLRINVGFPNGPEGRVVATINTYNSDVKEWIPEDEVDDIGDTNDWSDVETLINTLNPDGIAV